MNEVQKHLDQPAAAQQGGVGLNRTEQTEQTERATTVTDTQGEERAVQTMGKESEQPNAAASASTSTVAQGGIPATAALNKGALRGAPDSSRDYSKPPYLWINNQWYIPIDEQGKCISTCSEGALGFVLQIRSVSGGRAALKIPRLMAETRRENAYIVQLMEQEAQTVEYISYEIEANNAYLLDVTEINPLKGQLALNFQPQDEWNNALVFMRFEKSQNPYFCLVKFNEQGQLKKFPANADFPEIDQQVLADLRRQSTANHAGMVKPWTRPVALEDVTRHRANNEERGNGASILHSFNLDDSLQDLHTSTTWYTCIPSVIYRWAPHTLQETMGTKASDFRRAKWKPKEHLELISQISSGLSVLHHAGLLHQDLRPANVVLRHNASLPEDYVLSDYGSLTSADMQASQLQSHAQSAASNLTVVEGERSSVFYAPERSRGNERETADIAIVAPVADRSHFTVILGWKSELRQLPLGAAKGVQTARFLDESDRAAASASEYDAYIDTLPQIGAADHSPDLLQAGDRIRIRDFIFELLEPEIVGTHVRAFRCRPDYWAVYHDRIAIRKSDNDDFSSCHTFSISRITELLQWTEASDLYSLGVMALYSVYMGAFNSESGESAPKSTAETDDRFREMLGYLSEQSHFQVIWPRLEAVRHTIDKVLTEHNNDITGDRMKIYPYEYPEGYPDADRKHQTLAEASQYIVTQLNQTIPGIEVLLEAFDYRLGQFIFYMHFVLRCLHRTEEIIYSASRRSEDSYVSQVWEAPWLKQPFCPNRRHAERPGAAISEALAELRRILETRISHHSLEGLQNFDVGKFEIRDPLLQNANIEKLQQQLNTAKNEHHDLVNEHAILQSNNKQLLLQLQQLEEQQNLLQNAQHKLHTAINETFHQLDTGVYKLPIPPLPQIKQRFTTLAMQIGTAQIDKPMHYHYTTAISPAGSGVDAHHPGEGAATTGDVEKRSE